MMTRFLVMGAIVAAGLGGCTGVRTPAASAAPALDATTESRYRCDQGIAFTVKFADDSAVLDAGSRGRDLLLRDAGGATPEQTVYSNPRMRAEFGLGASGREAMLRYASPPLAAHCVRE